MEKLKNLFKYIKRAPFLSDMAGIDPNSGIGNKINGANYYNLKKVASLSEDEKSQIKLALIKLVEIINEVIKLL